ncbi:sporulation protein YunB [Thomasclavelia spiroformis]|uniref:sporulation protein YunB n=1 Tax=Thomasclavelia spiroformis TaxID=29348 RepID=UPI00255B68A0|nr:sporulation protein YunB [Thomasclavelia spiroformis]
MNQLEDLFYSIEAGTYQKEDNSFYQNKLQQMSDDGGLIATIRLGLLTDNPFLANVGPKINLKYKTISAITSTVEENIENYGVNHVMVSLKIVIKIRLMVLFPFYNDEFSHEYDYPLVMEVIGCEVPNWYQN